MNTRVSHQMLAFSLATLVVVSMASPFVALAAGAGSTTITGDVALAGSASSTSDAVVATPETSGNVSNDMTDPTGHYNVTNVSADTVYVLSYYQSNGSEPGSRGVFPRDDSPDFYTLGRLDTASTTSMGTTQLPTGHVVNLSVVNESGAPVSGAMVAFQHTTAQGVSSNTSQAGQPFITGADGDIHPNPNTRGLELTGNVTVTVVPPKKLAYGQDGVSSSGDYVSKTYTTNLSVSSDETVHVVLEEKADPSGNLTASTTTPLVRDPVTLSLSNITGTTPSFYNWYVDGNYENYTTHPNTSIVTSFASPGEHTVSVVANGPGETILFERSLVVDVTTAGNGTLTVAPSPARANLDTVTASLSNTSGIGAGDMYAWQFGDGGFNSTRHPNGTANHTYTDPGTYTVSVTVRNETTEALVFQDSVELQVLAAGSGTLVASPANATVVDTVNLSVENVSVALGQTVATYKWDFDGDSTTDATSATNATQHQYTQTGTFDATVTAANANGVTLFSNNTTVTVGAEQYDPPNAEWPQFAYDDANGGVNTTAVGPLGPVEVRWNQSSSVRALYSRSPVLADGRVYLTEGYGVAAYDAASGTQLWYSGVSGDVNAPATVEGDAVFVTAYDDSPTEQDSLTVFDATDGSERWSVTIPTSSDGLFEDGKWASAPVVTTDTVYVVSQSADALYAIDRTTHALDWRKNLTDLESAGDAQATPAVADGTVYVTQGWDGVYDAGAGSHLYAFDAQTGAEQWNATLSDHRGAAPTVVDGELYVSTHGGLLAYDAQTGNQTWSTSAGAAEGRSSPVAAGGLVIDTTEGPQSGGVTAVLASNGSQVWTYPTDSAVMGAPTVLGDTVYVTEFDGVVHALDLQTGTQQWTYSLDSPGYDTTAASTVVGGDGWLYVRTGSSGDVNRSLVALADVEPLASVSGTLTATPSNPRVVADTVDFTTTISGNTSAVQTYEWDFGDGNTASTQTTNTAHTYTTAGTYTPSVSGYDQYDRRVYTATTPVTVSDFGPATLRAIPSTADVNETNVTFVLEGVTLPASLSNVRYDWSFGDGTTDFTSANRTNHTYEHLGDQTASVTVLDGQTEATLVTASTTVSAVDRVPPTIEATAPSLVKTGATFNVTANATDNHRVATYTFETDEGQSNTTPSNRTELSFATAGSHTITVSATDPSGNTNSTTVVVNASAAPDLEPSIDVDAQQTLSGDPVTANVTVYNNGTDDATSVDLRLTVTSRPGYYSQHTTTLNRSVGTLAPGENETITVEMDGLIQGNLSRSYPDVDIDAVVDPEGAIAESDETNNRTSATTSVTYTDLDLSVYVPWRSITTTQTTATLNVRNRGNAPSQATTVDVDFGDGSPNETVAVPALGPGEWTRLTTNHTFPEGSNTVTASVDEPHAPDGNVDDDRTHTEVFSLHGGLYAPSSVQTGENFTVTARGYSNYDSNVSATLTLPQNVSFAPGEQATKYDEDDSTYFEWTLVSTAHRDESLDIEVNLSARGVNDTDVERVHFERRKTRVTDTSSVNFTGTGTETTTILLRNETTYDHDLTITTQLGANGRTLAGLDYLVRYPHACVEQTTSPMLGALYTDQYYRQNPAPGGYDSDKVNNSVASGVERLTTGADAQHANGAWSMYGNDPRGDVFYTAYALFGTSAVVDDPIQGSRPDVRNDLDTIDANQTVMWLADTQAADGRIANDKYYFDDDAAMTGFTLVALEQAGPYNATAETTADQIRADAASYLVAEQAADGSWGSGQSSNAMSTALAVWGLETSGVETPAVQAAIDDGVGWLVDNQRNSGSWTQPRSNSWSELGTSSETTAYALMALNSTGVQNTNATLQSGQTYLVTVYDDRGSWGYTRATALAINTLTTLRQGGANPSHDVTVTIGTNAKPALVTKTISVDSTTALDTVDLSAAEIAQLRAESNGTVVVDVDTTGTGVLVVGIENSQLVAHDEYVANEGGA